MAGRRPDRSGVTPDGPWKPPADQPQHGSVGLDVAIRLAATGFRQIGLMDFDVVEHVNLDRLNGATNRDARKRSLKVEVASRLASQQATAENFSIHAHNDSICEPEGLSIALDYDVILSCVDRPCRALFSTRWLTQT